MMEAVEWYTLLPQELRADAYSSEGGELAWPKNQALRVLHLLAQHGYIVVGVDVWLPTNPGPTIPAQFVYDWALKAEPRGDAYPAMAAEFIRTFEWAHEDQGHGGLSPVFNICAIQRSS